MSKKKKKTVDEVEQEAVQASADEQSELDEQLEAEVAQEEQEQEVDPLEAAQQEIAELKDKLLRQHAEMENLRKRTQREVADARKFAVEKFAVALLDVVDNLERAVETEEGNEKAVREGVALTLDSWHKVASKFELERIDAVGQTFDPHYHEALSKMPSDEDADTVIAQHVAGYTLNGRLIRPAKVLVSSGKT
ncbi:nucleotide exchange factor GrpE [Ghiorsea bivora]|uniref:nucleotide exchange factor GrpE n=1 Tax=Ghiorsea bivora TaxID=1485545 RepID=UPI00056E9D06|nr:nucleotide exchange factor GrpE [Ghiorsea bivora]